MKSFIKYFLIAIILALIIVITPMVTGIGLQSKIDDLILNFNNQAHAVMTLERVSYKSGWFSSMVTIKEKDVPSSERTFKVLHGPIYWSKGGLGFGYGELLEQEDPNIAIHIGFKGGIAINQVFNSEQLKSLDEEFAADNMNISVDANSDFSLVNTDFVIKAFDMKSSDQTPSITASEIRFTAKALKQEKADEKSDNAWLITFGYDVADLFLKEEEPNGEFFSVKMKKLSSANVNIDTSLLPMLPPPFDAIQKNRSLHSNPNSSTAKEVEPSDRIAFLKHLISQSANNKTSFDIEKLEVKDKEANLSIDKVSLAADSNKDYSEFNLDFGVKATAFKGPEVTNVSIDDFKFKLKALEISSKEKSDEKTDNSWLLTLGYGFENLLVQVKDQVTVKMDKFALNDINFDTAFIGKMRKLDIEGEEITAEFQAEAMQVITDMISQAISNKTSFELNKFQLTTPFFADLNLSMTGSWPDLPVKHDYLDVNWDQKSKVDFHLPKVVVPTPEGGEFLLEDFKYKADLANGKGKLTGGFAKLSARETKDSLPVELDNFALDLQSDSDKEKFSYDGKMTLKKACWVGLCGENAKAKLSLKNLSKKALRDIYMSSMVSNNQSNSKTDLGNMFALLGAYGNLVEKDSEVTFTFNMKVPEGDIQIDANANWKNMPQKKELFGGFAYAQYQVNGKFPAKMIDSIIASAATDKNAAEVAGKLQNLIENKMLVREGEEYILNLH